MILDHTTIEDVDATIRALVALTGVTVDPQTALSDVRFWMGVRKGLEAQQSGQPLIPVIGTSKPAAHKPTSEMAARSRKTQLRYWNAVRQIMRTKKVTLEQARGIYRDQHGPAKDIA